MSKKKLTPRQQAFAEAIVAGNNQSDAYRIAYDAEKMGPQSVRVESSRLICNPNIALTVEGLRAREEAQKTRANSVTAVSDRDKVLTKLRDLMDDLQPANIQLGAAVALGKTVALFSDVVITDDKTETPEQLKAELDKLIRQAEQAGSTSH